MFRRLFFILIAFSLSGCASFPGMKMESPPSDVQTNAAKLKIVPTFVPITPELLQQMPCNNSLYQYQIGPQDVLSIEVWDHPELGYPLAQAPSQQGANTELNPTLAATGFLVSQQGTIFYPLIGNVVVAGKTIEQIRLQLSTALNKFVRHAQVDVRVTNYRSHKVYVMGEVNKPGVQPITDIPLTITDVINLSGGLNQDTSDPSHIYVIRGNMLNPTVYWMNAGAPDALLLAEHFRLENNDVVFVSPADMARWNRAINQLLPSIQTIFYTQTTVQQFHT